MSSVVSEYIRSQRNQEEPKPAFWLLYACNTKTVGNSTKAAWRNMDVGEVEESIAELENAIRILQVTNPNRYFILVLRSHPKDSSSEVHFPFENPGFVQQQQKNGIAGIGSMGVGSVVMNEQIMVLHNQITELKMEIIRKEYERELDDMRAEIAAIASTKKKGFFDRIMGVIETNPTVQQLAIGMIAKKIGLTLPTQQISGSDAEDNGDGDDDGEDNSDYSNEYTEEQKKAAIKLSHAARIMREVFPDPEDAMLELAIYCKSNKLVAKNIRDSIKPNTTP